MVGLGLRGRIVVRDATGAGIGALAPLVVSIKQGWVTREYSARSVGTYPYLSVLDAGGLIPRNGGFAQRPYWILRSGNPLRS